MFFPVVTCGFESWTLKKAEHQIIDAFKLWCWRRLLGVPWTARRSNQSILKEINPEYSLEGPILKLKLQYFGHLMQRTDSLEKTLMLGKTEGRRRRGRQSMRWLDGIIDSMDISSRSEWRTGKPGVLCGVTKSWTQLNNKKQLQGLFPTQGSNSSLLHWQADSLALSHQGSTYLSVPSVYWNAFLRLT